MFSNQVVSTNPGFSGTIAMTAGASPKELTLLQRSEGLVTGLAELRARLDSFSSRISGHPQPATTDAPRPMPCGLPAHVSEAESELRSCFDIINKLNDAF